MKLSRSIFFNYISQLFTLLASVVVLPIYFRLLGPEAYGLVGFFSLLFSLFFLLDMGLTPTISREAAKLKAQAVAPNDFARLYRAIALVYALIGCLGMLTLFSLSSWIAQSWLKLDALRADEAQLAVELMSVAVVVRWMGGRFRGVLMGLERMAWLSAFNILVAAARYLGVLVVMQAWGYTAKVFFTYQLIVAFLEYVGLWRKASVMVTAVPLWGASLQPLQSVLRFGLGSAVASAVGVLLTQIDKFILAGILSLADFGHFSLVNAMAMSLMALAAPVGAALMPRMASLHNAGRNAEMFSVYRESTRLTSALIMGGALAMAFCAPQLLTAWTGDAAWAEDFWPVLALYALACGLFAIATFPYYLQYAFGHLSLHMTGMVVMLCLQVPLVYVLAQNWGVIGAGLSWLGISAFYLFVWGAVVHRKFMPQQGIAWILRDIVWMNWPAGAGLLAMILLDLHPQSRRENFVYVAAVGALMVGGNLLWYWRTRKI